MKKYAIFGASGFGREVLPLVQQQLESVPEPWDLVFVDDNPVAQEQNSHRVLTYADWLTEPASSRHITLAIANSVVRENLVQRCETDNIKFIDVKASNVVILDDVRIGAGCILNPFVCLTSNIRIGKQFHANIYSYVAHDCIIGDYVTFAPGVKCNGNVMIEDHAYIGTGAVLKQGKPGSPLVIGHGAVIGMGAVVTKSVAAGVTVVGNPARPLSR
jgi:sugar O-acyltransferase (sialic acid O-acetyltransferase NeuD family)